MSFFPRAARGVARSLSTRLAAPSCRASIGGSSLAFPSARFAVARQARSYTTAPAPSSSSLNPANTRSASTVMSCLRRMSSGPAVKGGDPFTTTNAAEFKEWSSKDGYFETSVHPVAKDRRHVTYFMIGGARLIYASAVRLAIMRIVHYFAASADLIAFGNTIVKTEAVPLGYTITVMWRGKPVFIRHRPPTEIEDMRNTPLSDLKDPATDDSRVKKPEYLVVLGICTHLGCVPLHNQGDYKGYFCPCHGSHYDASGRIRKGPAPLNLEVPPYYFDGDKIIIGD